MDGVLERISWAEFLDGSNGQSLVIEIGTEIGDEVFDQEFLDRSFWTGVFEWNFWTEFLDGGFGQNFWTKFLDGVFGGSLGEFGDGVF